jgi:hypothetical protein
MIRHAIESTSRWRRFEHLVRVVSASFHDSDGLGWELAHWQGRTSPSLVGRLMSWRRRKPTVRHDVLLLDAEFHVMLSELRYPSIYKLRDSSPVTVANIKRGSKCQHIQYPTGE